MDVCESQQALRKHRAVGTPRPPLVSAEKNNAVTTGRPQTRDVSSRYKSPSPARPATPRRFPSPNLARTPPTSSHVASKRAQSAERKRPSTPSSPSRPSTPVHDSTVNIQLSSRRIGHGRSPEGLWPSTMRSLSVSFQSDAISIPIGKKEKPVNASSDRTLRPASNVAHKQVETPSMARKTTPERKRSPLKGKNVPDQLENSRPVDGLHSRLRDQHRWPSRIGGKVNSNALSKIVDLSDKTIGALSAPVPGIGLSLSRRTPTTSDGIGKQLQKSASDGTRLLSTLNGSAGLGFEANSIDGNPLQVVGPHKSVSTSLSDGTTSVTPAARSQSLPSPRSRLPSPNKASVVSSSVSRGVSPSRTRPSTPPPVGISPSRIRPSNPSTQSNGTASVLSFIADVKKGKKGTSYIEDAHQLRLLYNRCLQWRFANARAKAVFYIQNVIAERTLFNVWNNTTLDLWDSVIRKRINLQQLKLKLKLNSVLNDQMAYLNDWALLENDHIHSLSGAVEDLEASTVRLPVTTGAWADIESLKAAISSAVDVMQAMGSSIGSLLSRVEGMNILVSELAVMAAQEKATVDECEAMLASMAAMQVEEYSLRTHLMQMEQDLENGKQPILSIKTLPWP
ncbi:AUGMIN subunit 8-like [Juglans microcarpa x Juglans regia]|uniref:AUGMIN subunit 8-like n=1 Tax=Juglans microcarpa x Juglans regia TaxID=2249226 RepID=UPI001B7E5F77|nr:AUGMIN subunit 8-like [Juglans microcarpa x Juglans regia]XP_040997265.1 AUGMIN subunit 8-like [Juglans microcarpa x Juglans regia]